MADNHHLILRIHQTFLNCFTPLFKKASFTNTNLFLSLSCFQFSSGFLLGVKRTNLITMTFGALKSTCVPSSLVQLTSQLPSSVFTSWGTAGSVYIHNILLPHLKTKTSEPVSLSAKLSKSCPNKFLKC